jgi:hypothetical protein
MLITVLHLTRKLRNEWSCARTSPVSLDGMDGEKLCLFLNFTFPAPLVIRSSFFFQFKCSD